MTALRCFLLGCVLLPGAASARACTVCHSTGGRALRAALFDGHFLHTMLLVMAPVPVLILAAVALPLVLPDIEPDQALSDTLALLDCEAAS